MTIIQAIDISSDTPKEKAERKSTKQVRAMLADMGCDPFEILAHIAMGNLEWLGIADPVDIGHRRAAASDLAQYIAPKLKSIEHVEVAKKVGGVMLIPSVGGSLEEWQRMVAESKIKQVEAKVVDEHA